MTREPCVKSLICFAALSLLATGATALAKDGGSIDPAGTWLTEDSRAKIRVEKCGADHEHICGAVVWLAEPLDEKGHPKTDTKNPDPALRSRPTLGMPLFNELTPDEDHIYTGKIYNAENGKSYDVKLDVDKPSELHVKGCVLSILCGSQRWTRVGDVTPPAVVATTQTKKPKVTPAQ